MQPQYPTDPTQPPPQQQPPVPPQPSYGPPPQQHYNQPPQQPHYMAVQQSPAAKGELAKKGQRDIIMGLIWIAAGIGITVCTYAADIPVYVVAWGPIVYGVIVLVRGIINMARGR